MTCGLVPQLNIGNRFIFWKTERIKVKKKKTKLNYTLNPR